QMASDPKKSRLSNGSTPSSDVIAFFPHNKPRRPEELRLEEHSVGHSEMAYTIKDYASETSSIFEVGREMANEEDGMDYVVAIVNKRTGETSMKAARLVSFQAVCSEDVEEAIGKTRRRRPVDFSKDYGVKKEGWFDAKNTLSQSFAGTKKMRILEAAKRREINETTLSEMRKTAFASEGTKLIMDETRKEALIDEKISLINKAESEVLPKYENAELAKDVYPLSIFVNQSDVSESADEVREMWKKSKEELEANGVAKCVHDIFRQTKNNDKSQVACALLAALVGTLKRITRSEITKEDYQTMILPKSVLQKMRLDFLQGNWRSSKGKEAIVISQTDKERMIAHTLCLAITLTPSLSIPVTPWARSMNVPENKLVKTLTALGCTLFNLQAADAVRHESTRAARLLSAPKEGEGKRRFRRSL
ncbi:hypothetical protein PFISCL1PPCAC_19441, partial [Pristionchus fissidentatus]